MRNFETHAFLLGFVRASDIFGVTASYYGGSLFSAAPIGWQVRSATAHALASYCMMTSSHFTLTLHTQEAGDEQKKRLAHAG